MTEPENTNFQPSFQIFQFNYNNNSVEKTNQTFLLVGDRPINLHQRTIPIQIVLIQPANRSGRSADTRKLLVMSQSIDRSPSIATAPGWLVGWSSDVYRPIPARVCLSTGSSLFPPKVCR